MPSSFPHRACALGLGLEGAPETNTLKLQDVGGEAAGEGGSFPGREQVPGPQEGLSEQPPPHPSGSDDNHLSPAPTGTSLEGPLTPTGRGGWLLRARCHVPSLQPPHTPHPWWDWRCQPRSEPAGIFRSWQWAVLSQAPCDLFAKSSLPGFRGCDTGWSCTAARQSFRQRPASPGLIWPLPRLPRSRRWRDSPSGLPTLAFQATSGHSQIKTQACCWRGGRWTLQGPAWPQGRTGHSLQILYRYTIGFI